MGNFEIDKMKNREDQVTMKYKINVVFSKKFKRIADWYSKNYDKEIGGFIIAISIDAIPIGFIERIVDSGSS